jgi:DNA-binding GntR family transcriptional regulator
VSSLFPKLPVTAALKDRRTTGDFVADALRSAILSGGFEGGEQLNQVDLAAHFGVSRVPVREALRRLQAEGLVSAEPHRPVVVIGHTKATISEIFELRALLEGFLLTKAAPNLDEARLARLEELCERMDKTRSHGKWLEANREFHRELLAGAKAEIGPEILAQLTARVERYLRPRGGIDRARTAGREHRRIVQLLRKGDVDGAREELERHIRGTRDRVIEVLSTAKAEASGDTSEDTDEQQEAEG